MQYLPRDPLLDTNNAIRHHIMKLKRNNLINKPMGLIQALIAAGLLATPMLHAQTLDPAQTEQRQREQQEQQRLEQLRQQQERARSQSPAPVQPNQVTGNATPTGPCFPINQVNWHRVHGVVPVPLSIRLSAYNGTHDVNSPNGTKCLNQVDIVALQKRLANTLIEKGYITSKINFPEQNIASGTLIIDWYPGTVASTGFDPAGGRPIGSLEMLFPNRTGQLYNQRDYDQALENLKRLSSQGNATIDLKPGKEAGTSDVVYRLEPKTLLSRINGTVGFDNAGSDSTGQYQGNASLSIDSPLHLNDQFTLNYNRNADASNDEHNSKSYGAYWDIATGYGSFNLGYNQSTYLQSIPGYQSTLAYTGKSKDFFAGVGWVLHRNSTSKTQASFKIGRKISHSSIDETEIPVQMRDYVYGEADLDHKYYHGDQQYNLGFNVRQNFPNISKAVGFIYGEPDWNKQWRVYSLTASASIPFKIKTSHWKWSSTLKAQRAQRPSPGSELFSLGSRYTVRGFDESFSISGEDGLLMRNELTYLYGANQRQQVYLGLDWGRIKGPSSDDTIAKTLAGAALGVRGNYHNIVYDVAIARPIRSPEYIKGRHKPSYYASLSYQF